MSSTARLVVSFQMMLDLVFIGVMVRLLFTVAQHGIARRDAAACSPLRLGRLPSGA